MMFMIMMIELRFLTAFNHTTEPCENIHNTGCKILDQYLTTVKGVESCSGANFKEHCPGLCPPCQQMETSETPECFDNVAENCELEAKNFQTLSPGSEECKDIHFYMVCNKYCTKCKNDWWSHFISTLLKNNEGTIVLSIKTIPNFSRKILFCYHKAFFSFRGVNYINNIEHPKLYGQK